MSALNPPQVHHPDPGKNPTHAAATSGLDPAGWNDACSRSCFALAFILWTASFSQIDTNNLSDFGLISILPWTVWAVLILLAVGFSFSLRGDLVGGKLPIMHLIGLVFVLHATPAIAFGTLRYSWAWKHIGIVDFIQRHGALDPNAPFLAAYHNWPGFFVVSAFLADLFDLRSIELANTARFAPTVFNLLFLWALALLLRRFSLDRRLVWTAAWIFLAGNWVGQDYFAPQAVAYLLYLLMLGLCLGPLRERNGSTDSSAGRFRRSIASLRSQFSRHSPDPEAPLSPGRQMVAVAAVLLIILAITATHQFTPIVVICALLGLTVIGYLNIGFFLFAVMAEVLWLLYFADAFMAMQLPGIVAEFGSTVTEALDTLVDTTAVSPGQAWVSFAARAMTLSVAAAALLGGLRRLTAGYRDGPAVILALAPVPVLAATSYGGEIIFRIYFFGLPFFAFFAAALFFPTIHRGHSRNARWAVALFGLSLAVGFVLANNGKDRQYTFTPAEVSAAEWLYESAPRSSILIEGASNYPRQFMNYENFSYLPIADESAESRAEFLRDPVNVLARWLNGPQWKGNFVIFTRSQKAYLDDMGIFPKGALDRVEKALLASARFRLVFANPDARIFSLDPAAPSMSPWTR